MNLSWGHETRKKEKIKGLNHEKHQITRMENIIYPKEKIIT